MAVNNLTYEQSYAFLNDLYEQATGQKPTILATDTGTFVTVGQGLLQCGTDQIISALSQVLQRTIFSVRPYSAKLKGLMMDEARWGAYVRKINFIDGALETDQRMSLTDGNAVDPFVVKKPQAVETRFYGSTEYQYHVTIFRDQLDAAFQNEGQFGSFISGVMQNITDHLEQVLEEESRACLINLAAGKMKGDATNAINVLQAYYDETGTNLTPETMYQPENYVDFTKWLYAFINTLTEKMAERSSLFHINLTGKAIMRHTPADRLKAYMSAATLNKIDSTVLSSVFNADRLKMIDFEKITYWQNINEPEKISAKPTYLQADGSLKTETNAVTINHVIGLLFDEEAAGITRESTWMDSIKNPAGGYTNLFYHFRQKLVNDFTENCILLYADDVNA